MYFITLTLPATETECEMQIKVNPHHIVRVEPYMRLSSDGKDPGHAVVVMTDAHLIVMESVDQIMNAVDKWALASSEVWKR